ncbi:PH domain-containing protein [Streptomyces sp. NPDC006990]|uniref:PH domain-containing protein n=1 Tax=Streptomyces sp. NPDC006990 TaxID=3154481 RepID=UPI003454F794
MTDPIPAPPAPPGPGQPGDSPDRTGPAGSGAGPEQTEPQEPGAGPAGTGTDPAWRGVERELLPLRRCVLLGWLLPLAAAAGVVPGLTAGPVWALCALPPLAAAGWGWGALARNWRSWCYRERADDLLVSRGVLWRETTVVPYGRMQLVEVTSGPLERRFGLASLQLHTAAATTDASIPGLTPTEAERLRDRLTELGEARSAGL